MKAGERDAERLRLLEDAIDRLREVAEYGTVVVEGSRDRAALEWLGIGGLHVQLHSGRPLQEALDNLASCPPPVVLLLDWDRTGGQLAARLQEGLRARVQIDTESRRRLASCCHAKSLEAVPGELTALRQAKPRI